MSGKLGHLSGHETGHMSGHVTDGNNGQGAKGRVDEGQEAILSRLDSDVTDERLKVGSQNRFIYDICLFFYEYKLIEYNE